MLFGLIFFILMFGVVVGATLSASVGPISNASINHDFTRYVRRKVTSGTSALFLMTGNAAQDKAFEAVRQFRFEIIATNLSEENEEKLRAAVAKNIISNEKSGLTTGLTLWRPFSFFELIIRQENCKYRIKTGWKE